LRGKCSACKAKISLRYPIVEAVTAIFSVIAIYVFGANSTGLACLIFTWCLIALTMIDVDTQLLPDSITLPLLWLGLIANYFGLFTTLDSALWGAIGGYLSLFSVYWLFKLLTGKEGMGFGDFKLLGALGAWLGWQMLLQIILLSALAGAIIGVGMIVIRGRDKNIPIPFGPYLAIAGWVALMWGQDINQAYLAYAVGTH
jgi:leader peptidase (prepilin peptidase) / N-methyltransferase